MIKQSHSIILLIPIIVICSNYTRSVDIPADRENTATAIVLSTSAPTPEVPNTPTSIPPSPVKVPTVRISTPDANMSMGYHKFEILDEIPDDNMPTGALVLDGDPPIILHFGHPMVQETFEERSCLSTSPDGSWLAYCPSADNSPTGRWLIVESADRQEIYKTAMSKNLMFGGQYLWLDNQQMIFPLYRTQDEVRPMMVINPFTGDQQELASDYPGLKPSYWGPAGTFQFKNSNLVYDTTQNLVVYPLIFYNSPDHIDHIVLWDRQSQTALASVLDLGAFGHYPIWSPDGEQVAIAVGYLEQGQDEYVEEFVIIRRDGQVTRITHFADDFTYATIGSARWSPDGKKIAFWIETRTGKCTGERLAILDIDAGEVTNTCIPAGSVMLDAGSPFWSLDSNFIAIAPTYDWEGHTRVYLLNIEGEWAVQLGADLIPYGWLKE